MKSVRHHTSSGDLLLVVPIVHGNLDFPPTMSQSHNILEQVRCHEVHTPHCLNLNTEVKHYCTTCDPQAADNMGSTPFCFTLHTVRGDATNSAVQYDNTKGHVCEITTVFDFNWDCTRQLPAVDSVDVKSEVKHEVKEEFDDEIGDGGGVAVVDVIPLAPPVAKLTTYSNLQKVPPHCTGSLQRGLFCKQLSAVGVRLWYEDFDADVPEPWSVVPQ
jgi:hypothetical protein